MCRGPELGGGGDAEQLTGSLGNVRLGSLPPKPFLVLGDDVSTISIIRSSVFPRDISGRKSSI